MSRLRLKFYMHFLMIKPNTGTLLHVNFSCKVSLKRSNNNTKSLKASQNSTWLHHWGKFVSCKDKFPINSSSTNESCKLIELYLFSLFHLHLKNTKLIKIHLSAHNYEAVYYFCQQIVWNSIIK
jgi:hypothetical protein